MTKIGIVTQARMTSTRLPGKVLMQAGGASMLEHHLRRLAQSRYPVYVATTTNAGDDPIVACAAALGIQSFRGSEADVLSRFAGTAAMFGLDVVVRVTSDCPLIDGALIDHGAEIYRKARTKNAYVSNTTIRSYPRGFDFEIFSREQLNEANREAKEPMHREHVTPYINQNISGRVKVIPVMRVEDASRFRVTLDTAEDLRVLTTLIEMYSATDLSVEQIIAVLEEHDEIVAMNATVQQKPLR